MEKKILLYPIKSNVFGFWTNETTLWMSSDRWLNESMMKLISRL